MMHLQRESDESRRPNQGYNLAAMMPFALLEPEDSLYMTTWLNASISIR